MFQINTRSETMPYTIKNRKGKPVASMPNPEFDPLKDIEDAETIPMANIIKTITNNPIGIKCDINERLA